MRQEYILILSAYATSDKILKYKHRQHGISENAE